MRAVLCRQVGRLDALELSELPDPVAGAGQVVIDVATASLNFPDLLTVRGLYQVRPEPPFVPGVEAAGTISAIGEGVSTLSVGQRVMAVGVGGAFAEKWAVDESVCVPIDDSISYDAAASLMLAYGTSYHALKQRADLQPGETLLVLGASGGVGSAAIEIGKMMGANVIAAASTDSKLAFCTDMGADDTINYIDEDLKARVKAMTEGRGVDVIYDPIGGAIAEQAFGAIARGGRHLVVGFAAGAIPSVPWNLPLLKGASIVGVYWGAFTVADPDTNRRNMRDLVGGVKDGTLSPRVTASYPLADFADAFDELSERRATGKVVLHPSD